ncbi:MinD/ParA family ATP-binding protein [Dermabacteraceae bacterium P13136]
MITIVINADSTGTITTPEGTQSVAGNSDSEVRNKLIDMAAEYASKTGKSMPLNAEEGGQVWELVVAPNGTTTPRSSDFTADENEAETPATAEPDVQSHQKSAADTSMMDDLLELNPKSAHNTPTAGIAPSLVATPTQVPTRATTGIRGALNNLGLKLPPSASEIRQHQEALEAERKQAAIEAQLRRQAQEQETRREARRKEERTKERHQRRLIQTNFQGSRTILVANPKGGARKTTTTYLLAATMGVIRGGAVIAWDANETMGTLGDRSQQDTHTRTVVDLLEDAAESFATVEGSRLGALDRFVRPQGDAHFDVLASDEDATRQDIVDAEGFATVHEILQRFYRLILVDTGNNIRVPHFQAALKAADQLVIPVAASTDSARVAKQMMKAFRAAGHEDLVQRAVVLIHDLEPADRAGADYQEVAAAIAADFEGSVAAVVPVPFDVALKSGDVIEPDEISKATQAAYREAAAEIAKSLRSHLEA